MSSIKRNFLEKSFVKKATKLPKEAGLPSDFNYDEVVAATNYELN